jgi:hypothetical protein
LSGASFALTTLRAGIIVGSGSASFEIIRDLVEKLPFMITPQWLKTRCQPIAIRNALDFLTGVIGRTETYNHSYDIGGPDILTYKEMLLRVAKIRGLKRHNLIVPVMTPKLSSYWLYFVTSTSYALAQNLVNSMKIEVICKPNNLASLLGIPLIDYDTAIRLAFDKIEQNQVLSSWKDAQTNNVLGKGIANYIEVPTPTVVLWTCGSASSRIPMPRWNESGALAAKPVGITAPGFGNCGASSINFLGVWGCAGVAAAIPTC